MPTAPPNPCPTCGAGPARACRTPAGHVTTPHAARVGRIVHPPDECPRCGAAPHHPCQHPSGRRTTNPHPERLPSPGVTRSLRNLNDALDRLGEVIRARRAAGWDGVVTQTQQTHLNHAAARLTALITSLEADDAAENL